MSVVWSFQISEFQQRWGQKWLQLLFWVEGVAAKKAPLVVAYMDLGERCEQERKLCSSII